MNSYPKFKEIGLLNVKKHMISEEINAIKLEFFKKGN